MAGFNNIIGHEEIIRHLKNAMKTGKVSHSYILPEDPDQEKASCNNLCNDSSV